MRPGDELSFLSFWGAKEYDRLAELPYGLEKTVRLGTFGFLARILLVGLRWIHDTLVPNYGWAIVLMTVLIRLLLLPLTHASMKSMKKMQELNPKMQAIREKYRTKLKDKQGQQVNVGKDGAAYEAIVTTLTMHADDMQELGVAAGASVRVRTETGEATFRCQAGNIPRGMLFVPYGPPTCRLMGGDTDGTGMPTSKGWDVEVEPIS